MPKKARRFTLETKLAAVQRMLKGESVGTLSRELTILRKDLYKWRANFLSGGPAALRGPGRPAQKVETEIGAKRAKATKVDRRIAELEKKLNQQETELEAIRRALHDVADKRRH